MANLAAPSTAARGVPTLPVNLRPRSFPPLTRPGALQTRPKALPSVGGVGWKHGPGGRDGERKATSVMASSPRGFDRALSPEPGAHRCHPN